MMNLIEHLKNTISVWSSFIKDTKTDLRQFELNCRGEYKVKHINGVLSNIVDHFNMIGKEVYKYQKSFDYILLSESYKNDDFFNPVDKNTIVFTESLYNEFVKEYLEYTINYLTLELVEHSITCNSTNKLTNLVFEWELECKQELIKIYKQLLKSY